MTRRVTPWYCAARVAGALWLVSFLIVAGACAAAAEGTPLRLQLKWSHQFQFAGYYAAVEKGYYREVGLDVTLAEGRAGVDFIEEVVSVAADIYV